MAAGCTKGGAGPPDLGAGPCVFDCKLWIVVALLAPLTAPPSRISTALTRNVQPHDRLDPPFSPPENFTMGGFIAVFIAVLIASEDGDENGGTIAFRTAGENAGETNAQSSGATSWAWSAARLLPWATIGTALKQQPLAACRTVGRSPTKQGGL